MTKTDRPIDDTKPPAPSPNPREKQRSRTTPDPEKMDENEPELTPKMLDKDFVAMNVDQPSTPSSPNMQLLSFEFATAPILSSNAFYLVNKDPALPPMTTAKFFGEEPDTFHSLNRFTKKAAAGTDGVPKTHLTVEDYQTVFQQAFPAKKVKKPSAATKAIQELALRMALADPVALFVPFATFWSADHRMIQTDMTCAWLAAYQLFGAPWKHDRTVFFPTLIAGKKAAPPAPAKRSARFSPDVTANSVPAASAAPAAAPAVGRTMPLNPYRITRKLRDAVNPSQAIRADLRVPHVTFFTLMLPRTQESIPWKQMGEVTALLQIFLNQIARVDMRSRWLPWADDDTRNPPLGGTRMTAPTSKAALADYTEKGVFTQTGSIPILRLRLGHQVPASDFEDSAFKARLSSNGMTLTVCPIQAAEEHLIGHMLGSHPLLFSADNWLEAHSLVPSIGDHGDLEFRVGLFETDSTPSKSEYGTKEDKSPQVVQVWTSFARARPLRNALSALYSSKRTGPLPMGHRMRFIPNILHDRLIVSATDRIMAKKARSKQRHFLAKVHVSYNYTIVGLRFPLVEYNGLTLHDAVSGICSRDDPSSRLFIAVEDINNKVAFLHRRDRSEEVLGMIPALPRVLEVLVGPHIWTWFSDDARIECAGFRFDPASGTIVDSDEQGKAQSNSDDLSEFSGDGDDDSLQEAIGMTAGLTVDDPARPSYTLNLDTVGGANWDDSSIYTTIHDTKQRSTPTLPPEVHMNSSPLSSTISSAQTPEAQLAAIQGNPALLAQFLSFVSQNEGRSPPKEPFHE